MDERERLEFVVYSKTSAFRRQFVADGTAELIANDICTATFQLEDDHIAAADVVAKGARCAVLFRGVERMRGILAARRGTGPAGTITASVESDIRKLWDWQMWPEPDAAIDAQTNEYRRYTGASETAFKLALQETIDRLGIDWEVATTHGWGSTVRVDARFHYIGEMFIPLLTADNLIVVITYDPADGHPIVDVRQAATVTGVLTVDSGIPDSYEYSDAAPTATRAVVGGRGEGVDRELVQVIDTARENDWADIVEIFVDARNTDEVSDISEDGNLALADAGPVVSLATTLVESERFEYGTTFLEGDLVPYEIAPLEPGSESIKSVSIVQNEDGVTVTPTIGQVDADDTDVELGLQVEKLAGHVRDLRRV